MKLSKKQLLMVSFMLFSMFFGAGNLIFPPFLGQNAGSSTGAAISAFLVTAVLLPVLVPALELFPEALLPELLLWAL